MYEQFHHPTYVLTGDCEQHRASSVRIAVTSMTFWRWLQPVSVSEGVNCSDMVPWHAFDASLRFCSTLVHQSCTKCSDRSAVQ